MKIYIAAPWKDRALAAEAAALVETEGWLVTHKWWIKENKNEDLSKPLTESYNSAFLRECAEEDIRAVQRADVVLLLDTQKSEGKAVEQGIAIAEDIPIFAVGKLGSQSMNVFHHLPLYIWFDTVEDAIARLSR